MATAYLPLNKVYLFNPAGFRSFSVPFENDDDWATPAMFVSGKIWMQPMPQYVQVRGGWR